jgi:hypothetical protein
MRRRVSFFLLIELLAPAHSRYNPKDLTSTERQVDDTKLRALVATCDENQPALSRIRPANKKSPAAFGLAGLAGSGCRC